MRTTKVLLALVFAFFALSGCQAEKTITDPPVATGSATNSGGGTAGCTPTCGNKQCGPDGCGSFCGTCEQGSSCNASGLCARVTCTPSCQNKECGPDGCGGFCGICPNGKSCNGAGTCTDGGSSGCLPNCTNKICGGDGCGNLCGKCPAGQICNEGTGQCTLTSSACGSVTEVGECQQDDSVAVTCKAGSLIAVFCDPALGLVCGYNQTKNKYDCLKAGCSPNCSGKLCGSDGCGGLCGQCKPFESCNAQGVCVAGDTCIPSCSGKLCGPDGCGGLCGICNSGETCANGQCINPSGCTSNCTGLVCGPDGCGGSCGTCQPSHQCQSGLCVSSSCTPNCVGKDCGNDGCGGSCGTCPNSQTCDSAGHCLTPAGCGNLTYEGACTQNNTVVTWCEGSTIKEQLCSGYGPNYVCAWVASQETYWCVDNCTAACSTKECGSNGCGGSCGTCPPSETCNNSGVCVAPGGGGECGNISWQGVCEGTTLKYCSQEKLFTINCGELGKTCGWMGGTSGNTCLTPSDCTPNCLMDSGNPDAPATKQCGDDGCGNLCGVCDEGNICENGLCVSGQSNECGSVTADGTCEGDTLQFCAGGSLFTQNCADSNSTCGWDPDGGGDGWFTCLASSSSSTGACGTVPESGICVNDELQYCSSSGTITISNCESFGLYCVFNPDQNTGTGGYDCLSEPSCVGACPANQRCQLDGTCGCDGLTFEGHCEGNVMVWCNNSDCENGSISSCGSITEQDCSATATACTIDDGGWAYCQ